jgi:hypothetical protein
MKRWSMKLVGLLSLLWMITSCVKEAYVEPEPVADAEMTLTLSFDTGTRASRIGDPGTDHGENTADWKNLGVYLVYEDGKILNFKFTDETFQSPKIFNVYPGTADVFVVAFPEGQEIPACPDRASVCNMKTLDVSTASLKDKNAYMRNIFSGVSENFTISKDGYDSNSGRNSVTVTCKRIVSKVDVQYDVQGGIENGNFVEAGMSAISFKGVPQAYIFPEQKTEATLSGSVELVKLSGTISERNGRAYAYMFPGAANLTFDINYKKDSEAAVNEVSYVASFESPLTALSWNKVNFTVSGMNAEATGPVPIKLSPKAAN